MAIVNTKDNKARFVINGTAASLTVLFQRGSFSENVSVDVADIGNVVEAIRREGIKSQRLSDLETRHAAERSALIELLRGKAGENP